MSQTPIHQCETCDQVFQTKVTLEHHQQTAKYCLKMRGLQNHDFPCDYCKKYLANKHSLARHQSTCSMRPSHENVNMVHVSQYEAMKAQLEVQKELMYRLLASKDEEIARMTKQIETLQQIATRPRTETHHHTTNTNNGIIANANTLNLTEVDHIRNILSRGIAAEHIAGGQPGIARFVVQNILTAEDGKLLYKCVDVSRNKFRFINQFGHEETDLNASKLSDALKRGGLRNVVCQIDDTLWMIDGVADEARRDFYMDKILEIVQMESDSSMFVSEMKNLTS